MRVLLALNGTVEDADGILSRLPSDLYVVGVDGGMKHVERLNLSPSLIIGDFDSNPDLDLEHYRSQGVEIRRFETDKSQTDLELALQAIGEMEVTHLTCVGVLGGRPDHALCNIFSLCSGVSKSVEIEIVDGTTRSLLLRESGEWNFSREGGSILSLVPIAGQWLVKSLSGVRWPLENETLEIGSGKTVSNEIEGADAELSLRGAGILLVTQLEAMNIP